MAATPDAKALPAGKTPERVDMRAGDERLLLIDCAPLLAPGELIQAAQGGQATPPGVRVTGVVARDGNRFEALVRAPAADGIKTWRDFLLSVKLRTTRGQSLQGVVTLRVHRE